MWQWLNNSLRAKRNDSVHNVSRYVTKQQYEIWRKAYLSVSTWKMRYMNDTCFVFSKHLSQAATDLNTLGHRREAIKTMLKHAAIKRTFAEDCNNLEERQDYFLEVLYPTEKYQWKLTWLLDRNLFPNIEKLSCKFLRSRHASISVLLMLNQIWIFTGVRYPERSGSFIRCCLTWRSVC